ncbi:membrane protein [Erwinia mallotivora]|uniref:Membrane protein n=1 Tax=Erwinia mallotivora TaxID=69222 RepID=A0A014M5F0_9GAMM|nr:membrane protein [Erwinia mallotivora]
MITNKLLAGTSLFFGWLGCCLIILSLVIYLFKRQDYYKLVSSYREKYNLPGPCVFYYMTGFFGVFSVLRFFIKLSHGKKISFLHNQDPGYAFFDDKSITISTWMKVYSFLWFAAAACYLLFAFFGLLLP